MFLPALLSAPILTFAMASPAAAAPSPRNDFRTVHERRGLPNVFAKLRAHRPVTIAYFGGSITEGAGSSRADETSYRGLVGRWFQTTFPASHVTNLNAAIGGTGSDLGAFRLQRDVLVHKPDLVVVEYAVNDGGTPDPMVVRAMEGIVRQIWHSDASIDICFVYTFVVGQLEEFRARQLTRTVRVHERVASHYGIPSVNVAIPAAQRLIDGAISPEQFSGDGVHPTDAGYQIYADALISFLREQQELRARMKRHRLPAALVRDSLEHARMIGPAEMPHPGPGWRIETKSPVSRFTSLLVSDTPGAELSIPFTGPILAMFDVLGPDTGSFDYKIDQAPWQTMDPFDVFAKGYHRAHYGLLADGLSNTDHKVTIRVRAEHNPDSKGTVTRIGYLLTNPPR